MKKLSWSTGSCWIPICIALEKYSSALKKCGRDRNAGDLPLHWVTFWGRGDVHFLETHGEEKPALLLVSCSRSKSSRCKRFHWQKRRRPTGTWWRSPRTPHQCRALQGSQNLEPDYSHLEKESCLHASVDQREKLSFRLRRPGANSPSAEPVTWLHFPVKWVFVKALRLMSSPWKASVWLFWFHATIWPSRSMSPWPVCILRSPSDQVVPFLWNSDA